MSPPPEAGRAPARVLVTGAGGPAALAVMESLRRAGDTVLAADMDPRAAGLWLVAPEERVLLPAGADPRFAAALQRACQELSADVLVPTVDSELLPVARERARFAALGTTVVLAGEDALRTCLDKALLAERMRGVIPVPRTVVLDAAFQPADPAWDWPLVVKPRSGSGSRDVAVLAGPEDLATLPRDGSFLVQELLPGQEYSVDVVTDAAGAVLAAVPRRRIKVDSGIAVTAVTLHDPELEAMATRVVEALGVVGVANVQLRRRADGSPALLEVNPRFPGSMPLTVAAGVDAPRLAVDAALGRPGPSGPLPFRDLGMVRWLTQVTVPAPELVAAVDAGDLRCEAVA